MKLYSLASIRTNNFTDKDMLKKIETILGETIKQLKEPTKLYGVYHAFESDFRGNYTLSIATETKLSAKPATCLELKGTYQVFEVNTDSQLGVFQTWQKIWALEEQGKLCRAYQADYELYDEHGQVSIHI